MWLFDSTGLMMPVGSEVVPSSCVHIQCDSHILTIHKIGVQQQVGVVDCGLFTIAFAVDICWQGSFCYLF